MRILFLHRTPYSHIGYHNAIDHELHSVTYIGVAEDIDNIPSSIPCTRMCRPGRDRAGPECVNLIRAHGLTFDCVISMSEVELLDAAEIRQAFGIPGEDVASVIKVRNKIAMKAAVSASSVAVPNSCTLSRAIGSDSSEWWRRTILKPIYGVSSADVIVFPSVSAALSAVKHRCTGVRVIDERTCESPLDGFEIEEFIEGDILHFDGVVIGEHCLALSGSKYIGTCLGFANGESLGSVQFDLSPSDAKWITRVVAAAGIRRGAFHLEAFRQVDGSLVFLEIANRVGGGGVSDTVLRRTGVHLPTAHLQILTGSRTLAPTAQKSKSFYGYFLFPGHMLSGHKYVIDGFSSFSGDSRIIEFLQIGPDVCPAPVATYYAEQLPLSGIIGSGSAEDAESFLRMLLRDVKIRIIN